MMFSDLVKGIVNDIPKRDWIKLQKLIEEAKETCLEMICEINIKRETDLDDRIKRI